jgi:hypothetical protein
VHSEHQLSEHFNDTLFSLTLSSLWEPHRILTSIRQRESTDISECTKKV